MREITLQLPEMHPAQQKVLDEAARYNVLACGRRWGKTTLGGNIIAPVCIDQGLPFGWFAPNYRLLEEAFNAHRKIYAPITTRAVTIPAPRIELITGGVIDYWTLNEPKTVARGRKYGGIVVDEAAMTPYLDDAWNKALRPTLTDYKGIAWFFSTPNGYNFFHTLFEKHKHDDDWRAWQMPTTANPYIDPAEVEAAAQQIPSIAYRQEYQAEFVTTEGARIRREWLRNDDIECNGPVYLGVDLAISTKTDADYTSVVAISVLENGTVYVRDAARTRAPFHQVLVFIEQMARKWNAKTICIEQVQYQAAVIQELLRTTDLPVVGVKPDKDKVTRFMPIETRYEQNMVLHHRSLPHWFEDEVLSFPIGHHDDSVDALVYAWLASQRKNSLMAI